MGFVFATALSLMFVAFCPAAVFVEATEICSPVKGFYCEQFGCISQDGKCLYPFEGKVWWFLSDLWFT